MLYYAPLESNLLEGVGNIEKRKIAIIVIIMLIRILRMLITIHLLIFLFVTLKYNASDKNLEARYYRSNKLLCKLISIDDCLLKV